MAGCDHSWSSFQKEIGSEREIFLLFPKGRNKKNGISFNKTILTAALRCFNVLLSPRSLSEGEKYLKACSVCHSVSIFSVGRLEKFSFTPFLSHFFHNVHVVMWKTSGNHCEHERSECTYNTWIFEFKSFGILSLPHLLLMDNALFDKKPGGKYWIIISENFWPVIACYWTGPKMPRKSLENFSLGLALKLLG